jgi:hypothetical protein
MFRWSGILIGIDVASNQRRTMMDKSDKTASLPKSINLNTWSVNKGKNKNMLLFAAPFYLWRGAGCIDR